MFLKRDRDDSNQESMDIPISNEIKKKKIQTQTFTEPWITNLQNNGFDVLKNPSGDGNCLYRSISYHLFKSEENWRIIKHRSLNWVKKNKDFVLPFNKTFEKSIQETSNESFNSYITRHSNEGEWGDSNILYAISNEFNININCIYYNQLNYHPYVSKSNNETIWIYNQNGNHFVAIQPKSGNHIFINKSRCDNHVYI